MDKVDYLNTFIDGSSSIVLTHFRHLALTTCFLFANPLAARAMQERAPLAFLVQQFSVEGANPLNAEETVAIFAPFVGRSHTLNSLQTVAKTLEQSIRDQGYAFYRVALPPQTLKEDARVRLQIIDFKLNNIEVVGNKYFDRENVIASIPELQVGVSPNNDLLGEQLQVANQNSSRKLKLKLRQSEIPDQIDALVDVEDNDPLQSYLLLNTRGAEQSGKWRLTGGIQHSNLWNLDHNINLSYTTSPDHADSVMQWGANYSLPLYRLGGWLNAYYAKSDSKSNVSTGTVAGGINISGAGEMMGVHYNQHLPRWKRYEHSLDIGLDDKHFLNNIEVAGQDVGPDVRSRPFSFTYRGELTYSLVKTSFYLSWSRNLDGGSDNTDVHYTQTRFGAAQGWDVLRYGISADVQLPTQWVLRINVSGQDSRQPLISGEQIGLGGVYSIRGYQEREAAGDNGHIFHGELWAPQWFPGVNLLAFYDYGFANLVKPQPGDRDNQLLRSTGFGMRWHINQHFDTTADFAHAFDTTQFTAKGDNMLHYSIMYQF